MTMVDEYPEEHRAADVRDEARQARVDDLLDAALRAELDEAKRWCPVCRGPLAPDEDECGRCWEVADAAYRRRVDI